MWPFWLLILVLTLVGILAWLLWHLCPRLGLVAILTWRLWHLSSRFVPEVVLTCDPTLVAIPTHGSWGTSGIPDGSIRYEVCHVRYVMFYPVSISSVYFGYVRFASLCFVSLCSDKFCYVMLWLKILCYVYFWYVSFRFEYVSMYVLFCLFCCARVSYILFCHILIGRCSDVLCLNFTSWVWMVGILCRRGLCSATIRYVLFWSFRSGSVLYRSMSCIVRKVRLGF